MRLIGWTLLALAAPSSAQTVTTSAGPERVSVTIYRAPGRPAEQGMDLRWLNGFALISETRRITIPAGAGQIRFEGVAGGIVPESAIVTGLPDGVVEKNQDALLLSPASLLDRSLGRRVHLRRTSEATGEVREQEAVVRSGKDGAVVLQTEEGLEALRCTGLRETIVYPDVPEGLTAKPTLSVATRGDRAAVATVTLSYLASGFDWQASYVATLDPAGERVDLFAWVTLANGDETSFVNADTQTVAGRINREEEGGRERPRGEPLYLRCWPAATTSDVQAIGAAVGMPPPPPPPPPAAPMVQEIAVTGAARFAREVVQEELGDLKLYRVPQPVTVASNSQKQIALLDRQGVKVETRYRQRIAAPDPPAEEPARRLLVTRNRSAEGLGLPLPAGRVVLFGSGRERPILLGEGFIGDRAVGEDVEIEFAQASGVRLRGTRLAASTERRGEYEIVVSNDQARPVRYELELVGSGTRVLTPAKLGRRNGEALWQVTIPANSTASLRYSTVSEG